MTKLDDPRWDAVEEATELLQTGAFEEAVEELLRVIAADDENDLAHYLLGNAFFEEREFEKAFKCYVRALEISPRYIGAMVGAGSALRMMGKTEQALRITRQALLVDKGDPDALFLAGCLHFQRGEAFAAKGFLHRFLDTRPELEVSLEARAMLKAIEGDTVDEGDSDDEDEGA